MRTYGTLRWQLGWWIIAAEPHVLMRAKRVFAQADRESVGELRLYDTPATSRDIEWFLDRFPLECKDLDRLKARARKHDAAMAVVQSVLTRTAELPTFELAIEPRAYQREAATLVLRTGRLLLGDDVGLGKTCSAIAVLSHEEARPAVVVTLTHLPEQWRAEIKRFAPKLDVYIPKKGTPQPKDLEVLRGLMRPDVVVLNYHKLDGWRDILAQVLAPKCVVFDEIQELRTGPGSSKYAAARLIAQGAAFRMGLSATPVFNYGGEIFHVINVLEEGSLGERAEFVREWTTDDRHHMVLDPKALGKHLREQGLLLRRRAEDVVDEVPALADPIRIPHLVDADTKLIEKAQTDGAELARIILGKGIRGAVKMQAAGELDWKLRQATGIAKAPYVAAFVRMLLESEERVVLYGWHKAVYRLWAELLGDMNPVFFTGEETADEKGRSKEQFLKGQARVLVMSLRAGAGLDGLQDTCRIAVFGELDWSPGVHEQCVGRLHRPGQKEVVRAYYLYADSGSDPVVMDVLGVKADQARGLRDPNAELVEKVGNASEHMQRLAEECIARAEAKKKGQA